MHLPPVCMLSTHRTVMRRNAWWAFFTERPLHRLQPCSRVRSQRAKAHVATEARLSRVPYIEKEIQIHSVVKVKNEDENRHPFSSQSTRSVRRPTDQRWLRLPSAVICGSALGSAAFTAHRWRATGGERSQKIKPRKESGLVASLSQRCLMRVLFNKWKISFTD